MATDADRLRWNDRFQRAPAAFTPHPLVAAAFAAGMGEGPVLELACGRSGSALALAETGRYVLAVDLSDAALRQLDAETRRRGLGGRVVCVQADLATFLPPPRAFALVLATLFWDPAVFRAARAAVRPGGLFAWEALAGEEGGRFRVRHGALGAALGEGWATVSERAVYGDSRARPRRSTRLLARRDGTAPPPQ